MLESVLAFFATALRMLAVELEFLATAKSASLLELLFAAIAASSSVELCCAIVSEAEQLAPCSQKDV